MGGHRQIGILKLSQSDVVRKDMKEKQVKMEETRPDNVKIKNQMGKRPKEMLTYNVTDVDTRYLYVLPGLAQCDLDVGNSKYC